MACGKRGSLNLRNIVHAGLMNTFLYCEYQKFIKKSFMQLVTFSGNILDYRNVYLFDNKFILNKQLTQKKI